MPSNRGPSPTLPTTMDDPNPIRWPPDNPQQTPNRVRLNQAIEAIQQEKAAMEDKETRLLRDKLIKHTQRNLAKCTKLNVEVSKTTHLNISD